MTDPLGGVTDDAVAFGDDAATTAGSVSYTSPDLTWTGTLAPGDRGGHHLHRTVDKRKETNQPRPQRAKKREKDNDQHIEQPLNPPL